MPRKVSAVAVSARSTYGGHVAEQGALAALLDRAAPKEAVPPRGPLVLGGGRAGCRLWK